MLFRMKEMLICFSLQKNETRNGLSNIKDTFEKLFQLQISVLHQGICIFKTVLSNFSDSCRKYQEKAHDVYDPNQNIEIICNCKLKRTYRTYKIYSLKGCKKPSQR